MNRTAFWIAATAFVLGYVCGFAHGGIIGSRAVPRAHAELDVCRTEVSMLRHTVAVLDVATDRALETFRVITGESHEASAVYYVKQRVP